MPHFASKALLGQLQENVREIQQITELEFSHLPDPQLTQPPAPDKWSIAQCLDHLTSYGHYYLPQLDLAIQSAERRGLRAKDRFESGWLGNYFAESMRPGADGTIRLKMKAVKNHTPPSTLAAQPVLTEFMRQQQQLLIQLERAQYIDIGAVRIPISITRFVKLSLGDTFRFLIAHEQRHVLQAQRVRSTQLMTIVK